MTATSDENRLDRSLVRTVCLALSVIASLALLSFPSWAPRFELNVEPTLIAAESGLAYTAPLRFSSGFPFYVPADHPGNAASNLKLSENGRQLGPAHSQHADIRSQGRGRFSHWNETLYFSASDGTDPRANGRTYTASASAKLSMAVWAVVLLADALIIIVFRRWLVRLFADHRLAIVYGFMLAAIILSAMLAGGLLGAVNPTGSPPKDPSLVFAIVAHAALGGVLTLVQWAMGAGAARLLLPKTGVTYAQVVLLGFPLSLALLGVLAGIVLTVPYGQAVAVFICGLMLWPLVQWPIERTPRQSLLRALPFFLVPAFAFGCWMALLWHGPTSTIPGAPSGDQSFYSSVVWGLGVNPIGWPNLANEGEFYAYFNFLVPAIGAALVVSGVPLDGFLFICSSAVMAILGMALAVHAYLTERSPLPTPSLTACCLVLALVAAGRTPSWIIYSPAVAFVVPLTISVWFWTVRGTKSFQSAGIAVAISLLGSALSKVASAGTLIPLALSGLGPHYSRLPRNLRFALLLVAAVGPAYAVYLLMLYLPFFIRLVSVGMTNVGPRSYDYVVNHGHSIGNAWPYLAQDIGILLTILAAYRLVNWRTASALAFGLMLVLVFPFLTFVNFVCSAVALGLASIDDEFAFGRSRRLVIFALLLVSAPMIAADEAGLLTGLVWTAIVSTVGFAAIHSVSPTRSPALGERQRVLALASLLSVTFLGLVASASGTLVLSSGWPGGSDLTPQVRDIWRAVRERTPRDSLIFTDQTGRDHGLLGGWNTYVFHGQRQVYMASWFQSRTLQANPEKRDARLRTNDEVLSEVIEPAQVKTSRPYGSYFAVVSNARQLGPKWSKVYANEKYTLYRWGL